MARATTLRSSCSERRCRNFVDPPVQGALLRQAIEYWFWASATFMFIILVYRVAPAWLSGKSQATSGIGYHLTPYLIASAALFPIVVFSANRFSNRFAGPMVRIRGSLKQLAQGETPPPLEFRKTDFWKDLADDINMIIARLESEQPTLDADPGEPENIQERPAEKPFAQSAPDRFTVDDHVAPWSAANNSEADRTPACR